MPFHCIDRLPIRPLETPINIDRIVEEETMLIEVALGALKGLPSDSRAEMTALQPVLIPVQDPSPVQKVAKSILKQPNSNTLQPVKALNLKLDFRQNVEVVLIESKGEYLGISLTDHPFHTGRYWWNGNELKAAAQSAVKELLPYGPFDGPDKDSVLRAAARIVQQQEEHLEQILKNTDHNTRKTSIDLGLLNEELKKARL